jgi:cathepsin D
MHFLIVLADSIKDNWLSGNVSGIMGFAYQGLSSTGATPFWETVMQQIPFDSIQMSFWLNRLINASDPGTEDPGGMFTFGGSNDALYVGNIDFRTLVSGSNLTYWQIEITSTTFYYLIHIQVSILICRSNHWWNKRTN